VTAGILSNSAASRRASSLWTATVFAKCVTRSSCLLRPATLFALAMDDIWQPLFQHAFESDVVLLGEGDTVGLHTNGAALVAFSPELQVHIDKATAADIEKSAVVVADKADVVSASTGAASAAPAGVASVSAGVASAAAGQVAETSDAISIAREEGLTVVPLPGSRRAIKVSSHAAPSPFSRHARHSTPIHPP